jgi:hypothetical protein
MTIYEIKKTNKAIISHEPVAYKGYTNILITSDLNFNDLRGFFSIIVDLTQEGDFSILMKVANRVKDVYFKIGNSITFFDKEQRYAELEQFMRNKQKPELTTERVVVWFNKNAFRYGEAQDFIKTYLNQIQTTGSDLYFEYCNCCRAVGYDPKPFILRPTDIDTFNSRLTYKYDNDEDKMYADGTRAYYDYSGNYCEEEARPFTKADRKLYSYNSKCKQSYNIASPEDVINVIALMYYVDPTDLAPDTYECECGYYNRYRTAQVEFDGNTGRWLSYPDTEVCCPCCGRLKRER